MIGTASPGLPDAFDRMAVTMEAQAAPMYAQVCRTVAEDLRAGGPSTVALADWASPAAAGTVDTEMVPLRLLAAVHALVLDRRAAGLATFYPDVGGSAPRPGPAGDQARRMMAAMFLGVLREHAEAVRTAVADAPQTNETGRSAALAGVLRHLDEAWGLPADLHELGAASGLNLRLDAFRFDPVGIGPPDAGLVLSPAWDPDDPLAPAPGPLRVSSRVGCDLHPVDPTTTAGRLRLTSYLWPEQPWRYERLRAALAVAGRVPASVLRGSARDHVEGLQRRAGSVLVVWHSALWPFPDQAERRAILAGLQRLGAGADATSPLAHVALEPLAADPAEPYGLQLLLTTWPGLDGRAPGVPHLIGHAPPHGLPVTWVDPVPFDLAGWTG